MGYVSKVIQKNPAENSRNPPMGLQYKMWVTEAGPLTKMYTSSVEIDVIPKHINDLT